MGLLGSRCEKDESTRDGTEKVSVKRDRGSSTVLSWPFGRICSWIWN